MEEVHDKSNSCADQGWVETVTPAGEMSSIVQSATAKRRLGFLKGQFTVPDDIKTMFAEEIEEMFYGYRAQHKFDDIEEAADELHRKDLEANG